jgi:hypothetical protein
LITASSTLAGIWITHHFALERNKLQAKRWYAEFFLNKKYKALSDLYTALIECHEALNLYGNMPPPTLHEFEEKVSNKVDAYKRAKLTASIFLNERQNKILSEALGAFRRAAQATWLSLPDKQLPNVNKGSYPPEVKLVDWNDLRDKYDKAVECLQEVLNPRLLSEIEKLINK